MESSFLSQLESGLFFAILTDSKSPFDHAANVSWLVRSAISIQSWNRQSIGKPCFDLAITGHVQVEHGQASDVLSPIYAQRSCKNL